MIARSHSSASVPAELARLLRIAAVFLGWAAAAACGVAQLVEQPNFAELERENEMWRAVDPKLDLEQNIARIRAMRGLPATADRVADAVASIWALAPDRDLDGLSPEAAETVREIDRLYLKHFRAARIREVAGIGNETRSSISIARGWGVAILRALDHDDVSEFRRCNNASAETVRKAIAGLKVPYLDRRQLYVAQRSFDYTYSRTRQSTSSVRGRWDRIRAVDELRAEFRTVLGDEGYLVYLLKVDPRFVAMYHSMGGTAHDARTMLQAWELRSRYQMNLRGNREQLETVASSVREELRRLVGVAAFESYAGSEDAKWMFPRVEVPAPRRSD
jgi:hypothetical protein